MKIKAIKVGSATVQAKIGKKKYNCKIKIVAVATTEEPTNEDKLTIEDGTVTSCDKGVTRIVIPEGVTAIGDFAFAECRSLESITIPSSVATIGGGAFTGCSSLESVTIPESVTTIGNGAFSSCSQLNKVEILNGDVTFGLYVFDMCADNLIIYCAKDSTAWQYAIDKGINHEGLSR